MDTRQQINMIGGGCQHSVSTSGYEPLYVTWVKGNHTAPISFYIDYALKTASNPNTENYGWLHESKTINVGLYEWAADNVEYLKNNFKRVFTHDVSLLSVSDIFALHPTGKSFIEHAVLHPKTKLVSMIASSKMMCPDHIFRHNMIAKFAGKCDHFGRGFREIPDKVDGLKDYCFSIAMENGTYPNMVSEKITDCFMTGTIPIFYGIPNIGDFFNTDGIITLNDDFKIESLSFELYYSKLDAVKDNLKRAEDILVAEDYIYLKYIKK
jgi:hypothetical protein